MAVAVIGSISRLYSNPEGCYIKLSGIATNATPKNGYFQLKLTHPNYNALYSLIMAAAINRYKIQIRATSTITSLSFAEVLYVMVDW